MGLHPNGFQDRPVMTASVSLRNSSYGAVGETRTRTIIRPLPPQDSVSANSTTTAWWALQDSNLRPIGYEPTALPAELRAHSGVPEEIRTPDTRLRRPLLYPAELLGQCCMEGVPGFEPGNKGFADPCLTTWLYSQNFGAIDGNRTHECRSHNPMR